MKVSIVIPNYNGKKFLEPCLTALEKQSMKDFEIIIVDNASTDGSIEYMKENYSQIKLISLDKNTGFSYAVNVGIKAAKAPYVLLLNNDTEVFDDFVEELYKCIKKNPKVFSASSKMIRHYDHDAMDGAGDLYSVLGWAFQKGAGKPVKDYEEGTKIFTACAGAAIYRKSVFDEIGYFDETFFAYREDIDIGYRARIYGYTNIYCPSAKVYHVGSGTSGSTHNAFKVKLGVRNNILVNYKNMPLFFLVINMPFLIIGYVVKWLFFIKKGFGKEYKQGLLEAFEMIKQCKKIAFRWSRLHCYIKIQLLLYWNTLLGIGAIR